VPIFVQSSLRAALRCGRVDVSFHELQMGVPLRAYELRGCGNEAVRSFRERKEREETYSDGHCDECDGVVGMGVVPWA
jgi:hypothetical protein